MFIGYSVFTTGVIWYIVCCIVITILFKFIEYLDKDLEKEYRIKNNKLWKKTKRISYAFITVVMAIATILIFALSPVEHHDIQSIESPTVQQEIRETKIAEPEAYSSDDHAKDIHQSLKNTLKTQEQEYEEFLKTVKPE
jgi:TRAP-type C4-dicarboxylate transport system permease large subunit